MKDILEARIPPQDLDAEKALLGSIMLSPDTIHDVSDLIYRESFYAEKHRILFEIMLELASRREPIDLVSVTTKLKEKKLLESIGGAQYVADIANSVPSSANIRYYAQIVYKKKILRDLIQASNKITELGYNEEEEIEHVLEEAEKNIYKVTNITQGDKFTALKDTVEEAWDRIEKLQENKHELRGVPTGFRDIDAKLSGFQKSDLIILAARPSVGKTSIALDFARHAATKHGVPVAIFSLEMSTHQLVDRMVAAESQIDSWKLRTGNLSLSDDLERVQHALGNLAKAPIFIDDQASSNIMRMRSLIRRYNAQAEKPLGLVVVDYLQLMSTTKNYDSMVNQVTEISRSLKGLAKEFDVPVIALSQLSRAVEARGGEPRLSDLRDSGSIEQDADVVLFIHREDKNNKESERKNIAKIIIAKHRNGATGEVELYFDDKRTSFVNLEKNEFGDVKPFGNAGQDSSSVPDFGYNF
jgi:replicative DNA helicase